MDNLLMTFKELYGEQQPKLVKSPLRICPLGAHVDHQDGVVTGMALAEVNGLEIPKRELVFYSHWVETEFIGLKNGILDQSANILSEDNQLLVMDCQTSEHYLVEKSAQMPEFEVLVVYSGVTKALIGTDYNNRVDECKVAGWMIEELAGKKRKALEDVKLRDIPEELYQKHRDQVPGKFKKRADHYFTEQQRVHAGVEAWRDGDIETFGQLMFESGASSIDQYESGCPELITIYDILKDTEGVYGARFSGAGYRGCCVGLIDPAYKAEIEAKIDATYPKAHPDYKDVYKVYFCQTSDGAQVIDAK